ncbi:MAG TPA: hypothetical protein VF510_08225, partial [Ktedonobacterales bacterium]
ETIHGRPGNLPGCTGARTPVTLGKIIPGANTGMLYARIISAAARNYTPASAPTAHEPPNMEKMLRWPSPRTQRIQVAS